MNRFTPVDVSNASIGVHLYPTEEVLVLTEGVGLYSGPSKSARHASGTVYLTSHRIFYVDDAQPHRNSCFLPLNIIRETQYYAGFLKSSPKVTLGFRTEEEEEVDDGDSRARIARPRSAAAGNGTSSSKAIQRQASNGSLASSKRSLRPASSQLRSSGDSQRDSNLHSASVAKTTKTSWICRVCAFSNALDEGVDKTSSVKCQLCGVSTPYKDLAVDSQQSTETAPPKMLVASEAPASISPGKQPSSASDGGISCPVCTFKNHPSMLRCEMCESSLGTLDVGQELALQRQSTSAEKSLSRRASTRSEGAPVAEEQHNSVRLSFRKGGDKAFYDLLKPTLQSKRWLRNLKGDGRVNGQRDDFNGRHANIDGRSLRSTAGESSNSSRRVGIEGIMSAVDLQSREESSDMQDALRDLEALMTRAKKMVDFAEALNAKLVKQEANKATGSQGTADSSDGEVADHDEAAQMIRASLVRLGLPAPAITADMAKDELEYNMELARELAGLLYSAKAPIIGRGTVLRQIRSESEVIASAMRSEDSKGSEGQGIIPLDEIWCIWNRARGVALVTPKELLAVCPLLPRLTQPRIECKTFPSGLLVLHTPRFADAELSRRVCSHLRLREETDGNGNVNDAPAEENMLDTLRAGPLPPATIGQGLSTLELAHLEACPLHLMDELLAHIEQHLGAIARDEHAGVTTWFINHISMYTLA